MQQLLEKEIKHWLKQNLSKKEIFRKLRTEQNQEELLHMLNNLPSPDRNQKTLPFRFVLLTLLVLLTIKQFLFVYLHENSSIALMLGLIGPFIHIYIMRELLRGHRLGYQILPILSILAFFRPENRIMPDILMYVSMAMISGVLFFWLFPKKERLEQQT